MNISRTVLAVVTIALSVFSGILIGLSAPATVSGIAASEHGALPWIAERVFAFMAYWVITASVVYGLLLSTKLLSRFAHHPVMFTLHRDLAAIALGLAGIHGTLLMLDTKIPFSAWEVMIPFLSPYEPVWVAAGQIALYMLALVSVSWYLRKKIGVQSWRAIHGVMLLAFIAATAHGLLIGTDGDEVWAVWVYSIATAMVAFLLIYRLYVAMNIFCDKRRARREDERRAKLGLTD
jgi:predicted ferric reductase